MQRHMLIISLDGDYYGIDVRLIQEVIKAPVLRELPDAPNFIEGIISLRDAIIPMIKIKRLLDIPTFDLFPNKKVVIIHFGENVRIGVMVDNIIGIQNYEDSEIRPIDTISSSNIIKYILGVIKKDDKMVGILDIFSMFFSNKGDFLYKHFFNKGQVVVDKISRKEFFAVQQEVEKNNFPFNKMTQAGILKYISKISSLSGKKVEKLIKEENFFQSTHFDLEQKRKSLFENRADIYMIHDILKSLLKKKDTVRIWVLGNGSGEDAYSIAMLFHSFEMSFKKLEIINSDSNYEKLVQGNQGRFSEDYFQYIPITLWTSFFDAVPAEGLFQLKPEIKKLVQFDFYRPNIKFFPSNIDLIYAPNFLARNRQLIESMTDIFEKVLNPEGILALGLFEDIEAFVNNLKKYYIKNRLVFIKEH